MADTPWDKLAAGLEEAAQAARQCANEEKSEDADESKEDESTETPVDQQPKSLKSAAKEAYGRMTRKPADQKQ